MKVCLTLLATLLLLISSRAVAHTSGRITFTGRIVESSSTTPLAKVIPESVTNSDGTVSTVYAVQSVPTGDTLATFTTPEAANTFAAQVTPAIAYRE